MSRWAGPPPLLIAATVLAILVAPAVSQADDETAPREQAGLASSSPTTAPTTSPTTAPTVSESPAPTSTPASPPAIEPTTAPKAVPKAVPEPPAPRRIGVVTFNQYRQVTTDEALEDARRLTSRPGVAIIGWQEAYDSGPVFARLSEEGWGTKRYVDRPGMNDLAVSWRRDEFAFVDSQIRRVASGVSAEAGRFPFGPRYGLRVTLRDRASDELISVINTHLPQRVEDLEQLGTWRDTKNAQRAGMQLERLVDLWDDAPGRWVVGTGDYNVGAGADQRFRTEGGVRDTYAGTARSSYSVLGFDDVAPTHPTSRRYIDYVHASTAALRQGRIELLGQRSINDVNSDHRPLIVWMRLS